MTDAVARMPERGGEAPAFTLPSSSGKDVSPADFAGKPVVLYFYPKDNTPGCTIEALEFRDHLAEFEALDAAVLGVSPDDLASHCRFIEQQGLNFVLLADVNHEVAERYGVWVEKKNYGRTYWGIQRATFLIGRDGRIAEVWPKVTPKDHAAQVLAALNAL